MKLRIRYFQEETCWVIEEEHWFWWRPAGYVFQHESESEQDTVDRATKLAYLMLTNSSHITKPSSENS